MNSKSAPAIPVDRLTHIDDEATTFTQVLAREHANILLVAKEWSARTSNRSSREFQTMKSQQYIRCTVRGDRWRGAKIAVAKERAVRASATAPG